VVIINTFKKQTQNIHQLPSGHFLDINAYHYFNDDASQSKVKSVYIQASVHGAELQGNLVIYELHQILRQVKVLGKITMVPLANPLATNQKNGQSTQGRFNPITGDNWNRNYTDIITEKKELTGLDLDSFCASNSSLDDESIRQNFKIELKKALTNYRSNIVTKRGPSLNKLPNLTYQALAADADIVLDLHTGPCATDYIYAAKYQQQLAKDLNFPFNLIIPNKFAGAMDEACFAPWLGLQDALISKERQFHCDFEAYTLELGNEELISSPNAKRQALRIADYLVSRGVIENLPVTFADLMQRPQKQIWCLLKDYCSLYAPYGGLFEYHFSPGDFIKKGQSLGRYFFLQELDLEKNVEDLIANKDYYLINHNISSSVHLGSTLFQCMQNFHSY
jgi:uncharacterized protein